MNNKNKTPSKFFWVDLEMTGLNAQKDVILEVAAEITDANLETLASYEARIRHPQTKIAKLMKENDFWQKYSENRNDFLEHAGEGKPLEIVEQELIELVKHYFADEQAILAGNSIHSDKKFIESYMPSLDLLLHYRLLDVSSWKVVLQAMHGEQFDKPEVHRAYEDIQASIAELQHYLDWFKKQGK